MPSLDDIEAAAQPNFWSAPGVQGQRPSDDDRQKNQDEEPSLRISGKGMHRREDTGTDKKRPQEAQRKCHDGEQNRPHLEPAPLVGHGQ